jgi:DNA-binding transcriptional LysR family regulator
MAQVVRQKADWSDVRVFWAVAELGSFGAAARALKLGLTTVTRTVDRLESRLNAKLLTRGPQGVTLTEAGAMAYDRALSMERVAEQLEREILDREKAPEGHVKLAAPDGIAGIFLAPSMPEFIRANPKINLVVDCELWPDRPLQGEADVALTFQEPKQPDMIATPLGYFHYALLAARDYLDLYGMPKSGPELLAHPYVHHVAQTHHKETWKPAYGAFVELIQRRIETNSSAVSFAAVKQGAGIGLMPTAALALDPSLVMIETPDHPVIRLWMVHHRETGRSARVRRVTDWLKDVFNPKVKPWYREEFVHPREFAPYLDLSADQPMPVAAEASVRRRRPVASS